MSGKNFVDYFKNTVDILKAGVVGAVFIFGICILSMVCLFGFALLLPSIGMICRMPMWTMEGVYTAFVAAGIIGFIVGIFVCRQRPHVIQKWFIPTFVIGAVITFNLWLFYEIGSHTEFIRNKKLADCTNLTTKVNVEVPKGRRFDLRFELLYGLTNRILGQVIISKASSTITNFQIDSTQFAEMRCNFLQEQTNYDLEITFEQEPPPSTSIWLRWLQAYKDRDK